MGGISNVRYSLKKVFETRRKEIEDLLSSPVNIMLHDSLGTVRCALYLGKPDTKPEFRKYVADFSLSEFPGCCGVIVSHNVGVGESYRNKGLGKILHEIRLETCKGNAGRLMCTTIAQNEVQELSILPKYGWKVTDKFVNPNTGNTVSVWSKEL